MVVGSVRAGWILTLLCALAPIGAGAAQIRYTWTGSVEPGSAPGNPWGVAGDGSALTQDDGTPFSLELFVDEAAPDLDGSMNPDFARFATTSASLILGGTPVSLGTVEVFLSDDDFGGLFDEISVAAQATVAGTTLNFQAAARLPATSFSLSTVPAPDLPQLFATSPPIQLGGFGGAVLTYPANAPVTATLVPAVPEPASGALLALGLCALAWRRR